MNVPLKSSELNNNISISLNPIGLNRTYGVIFDVLNGQKKFRIHFEVVISCDTNLSESYFIFEIIKKDVFINNSLPENLIDQLTASCGSVLYPLAIIAGKSGEFKGVNNKKAMIERWKILKKDLERYYKGETAEVVLENMESAINNSHHLVKSLFNDQFISLYFSQAYLMSKKGGADTAEIFIPVVPFTEPVKYKIKYNADYDYTDNGTFQVYQTGNCTDQRSAGDILKKRPVAVSEELSGDSMPLTGNVDLKYSFYTVDCTVCSITGSFNLQLFDELREVKVQVYHLKEKDIKKPLTIEVVPPGKKKNGFFSFFN